MNKCETHEVELNDQCCNCGAPVCCPVCCKEAADQLNQHLAKIHDTKEASDE